MQKLAAARFFALMLGGFVLLRGLIDLPLLAAIALGLGVVLVLAMIWAPAWVATHVMPWARLQSFKADAPPSLAVSVLGWAILLLLLALVLYLGPTTVDPGADAHLDAIIEEAGREASATPSPVTSSSPSPSASVRGTLPKRAP